MKKPRNPQDTTLRNVKAGNRRDTRLANNVNVLRNRVTVLEREVRSLQARFLENGM